MPNYQKHIVYLSDEQRQELFTNGSITVNGQTVTYSDNDMYVTPQEAPVTDVQVNGTSVTQDGVADIPIASANALGVVKIDGLGLGINSETGRLQLDTASVAYSKGGIASYKPIAPDVQHAAAFYGLAKAAGSDENASTLPVGQYTDNAKTAIREMLDTAASDIVAIQDTQPISSTNKVWLDELHKSSVQVPTVAEMNTALEGKVGDVQINGSSIVQNGVANLPVISDLGQEGLVRIYYRGLTFHNDPFDSTKKVLGISIASDNAIKLANSWWDAIVPVKQHMATFYGLAAAAGDTTQSQSSNAVGNYTDPAKAAIQNMLGVSPMIAPVESDATADRTYAIGEIFSYNGKLYQATDAIAQDGTINPSINCQEVTLVSALPRDVQVNGMSVVTNGVANVPKATTSTAGVIIVGDGLQQGSTKLLTNPATLVQIKAGIKPYEPIVPSSQHASAFYGLAKAAGDTTQSQSDNAVGTYTDEAKTAIRSMLGAVGDVQVDSTSIVTNGVAEIPKIGTNQFGVGQVNGGYGIGSTQNHYLYIVTAIDANIKAGANAFAPITPSNQHTSVFYGLAKAAGDTTQSQSSNAVGTYTDNAKASIKAMLGVVDGSTGTVDITGTTPTVTAVENTRYVCGEVSTLTFTPPSSGITIVRFTSGTTPAVLTVPNTVIFPEWFDASTLEASRIYEICITDGVYGAVMSWPL